MSSDNVAELITALRSGEMGLDRVADIFRHRTWRKSHGPVPSDYSEMAAAAQLDPGANIPGSIDDVIAAYDRGEISREQYRVLAHAVAESINAEAERRGGER